MKFYSCMKRALLHFLLQFHLLSYMKYFQLTSFRDTVSIKKTQTKQTNSKLNCNAIKCRHSFIYALFWRILSTSVLLHRREYTRLLCISATASYDKCIHACMCSYSIGSTS